MRHDVVNALRNLHNANTPTLNTQRVGLSPTTRGLAPTRLGIEFSTHARHSPKLCLCFGRADNSLARNGMTRASVGVLLCQLIAARCNAQLAQRHINPPMFVKRKTPEAEGLRA
jgi:hypothetical protein